MVAPWPVSRAADDEAVDAEAQDDSDGEGGIGFPGDRLRERQLDRARRLVAEQRWSDAATLLDEILGADRDAFFRVDHQQRTWQSIKSEAGRLIGTLAKPGRDAYDLQFRARADRLLEQAIAANDSAGVLAVARRWFHTPAGRRATMLSAIEALEMNQPLAAAAWLDRLAVDGDADAFEPTLSVMRSIAWLRAGDRAAAAAVLEKAVKGGRTLARLGGRDVSIAFPPGGGLDWLTGLVGAPQGGAGSRGGDWRMHRGDAARNGVVNASRPLLVPRYRVPLARHPEESRLLESRRRLAADQELPILPAGTPLAIDGTIVLHTTMGLLAVDFETGKRIWLQTGGGAGAFSPAAGDPDGAVDRGDADGGAFSSVFEDATGGGLSSDGHCVFAVESHPGVLSAGGANPRVGLAGIAGMQAGGWRGGNSLAAYDLAARGSLRWRLPVKEEGQPSRPGVGGAGAVSFLGAPLPAGDALYVLAEEKGEIRLDVLDAATGRVAWSQPLAEVDEDRSIDSRDSNARRLAGLSPALAEGVLVCPTGAGAVVAVDLATRTLLWAYDYPQTVQSDVIVLPNGMRMRRGNFPGNGGPLPGGFGGAREQPGSRWLDSAPILHEGRVLLSPGESQELHCLDLRRGELAWKVPRQDRLFVAGAVDGTAIVVGRRGVEALEMATGKVVWQARLGGDHGSPSGRAMLAPQRLFLPLDTPEVLEIDLADGRIVGRSVARGNAVPGNLLAYRGEVISQGVDSLDVFHQSAPLESRIESALKSDSADAWAMLWRGQLDLDGGDVPGGVAKVRAAHAAQPSRVPASMVAEALRFALDRDFAQSAGLWREAVALSTSPQEAATTLRTAVDGFVRLGDLPQAWEALQTLLAAPTDEAADDAPGPAGSALVPDGADPQLAVAPDRWLHGRIAGLFAAATPALRQELDASAHAAARAAEEPSGRRGRSEPLRQFIDRFGRHDAALAARRRLVDLLGEQIESSSAGDERRDMVVAREFLLIELSRAGLPADREYAAAQLAGLRSRTQPPPAGGEDLSLTEWPIGKVVQRRGSAVRANATVGLRGDAGQELRFMRSRLMNIPVANGPDSFLSGLELAFDLHQQSGIVATDGFGRQIGDPFGTKPRADAVRPIPLLQHGGMDEASVLGRVVFVRAGGSLAAFELSERLKGGGAVGGVAREAANAAQEDGRNRGLWMAADASEASAEARAAGFVMNVGGGRAARDGALPLGARVSEPRPAADDSRRMAMQGGRGRCSGVPLLVDKTLRLHDPRTGRLIWERQRVPAGSELIGDDDVLVACPPDGRGAVVVSMADGRMLRTLDIPAAEHRLFSSGRRIAVAQSTESRPGEAWARRVRIDIFDPLTGASMPLGEYAGEARTAEAGPGRLAIVEPTGDLTVIDADAERVAFRTRLPEMPVGMQQLQVLPWRDRYLVMVGRAETPEEQKQLERIGAVGPLPGMPGRELPQVVTGSIWAVDRDGGEMLWPVPATVLRHSLQRHQAAELPVMLFARSIQPAREPERPRLSLLCIDKRTGQAVYVDDRFGGRSPPRPDTMMLGCSISGDPSSRVISITHGARDVPDLQLEFTGQPAAPRPPFQAAAPPNAGGDSVLDIEYWLKKAITLPFRF